MNGRSRKIWTSSFMNKAMALRAVKGICSKSPNLVKIKSGTWSAYPSPNEIMFITSRGFNYKKEVKAHNNLKNRF